MAHIDPTSPNRRIGRVAPPAAQDDELQEFAPILSGSPAANHEVTPAAHQMTDTPPTPVADAAEAATPSNFVPTRPKKAGPGRPRSTSKPIAKPGRPRKEEAEPGKKKQTSLYLWPADHKRLRWLCLDIDMPMTEFAESACLDAMYNSYRCREASCNCEFVIRSTLSEAAPSCPGCGSKKLDRLYKL